MFTTAQTRLVELEAFAERYNCIRCGSQPRVVWKGGLTGEKSYGLRCNCTQDQGLSPVLTKPKSYIAQRRWNMVSNRLATQPSRMPLTVDEISKFISPNATEPEAEIFLRFCVALDLNPFIREAYLIKYSERDPAAIVIGIDAYLKRAANDEQYGGYQSGVVVEMDDGTLVERDGSMFPANEELIGGWMTLYRRDWDKPLHVTVSLREYMAVKADGSPNKMWRTKPGTMIEKVAITQGLRRAFPAAMAAFASAELPVEVAADQVPQRDADIVDDPNVVEGTVREVPDAPKLDNVGDLLNDAYIRWGKASPDVCGALGVAAPVIIKTRWGLAEAWDKLAKLWEPANG